MMLWFKQVCASMSVTTPLKEKPHIQHTGVCFEGIQKDPNVYMQEWRNLLLMQSHQCSER